jgi:enoyl-CoA hydratase/carnithine racemase
MIENPETLILERDGAVLWVRLNRPDARNGINMVMRDELQQTFHDVDDDPEIRAMVLTGQGRTFCTGGDLMPSGGSQGAAARPRRWTTAGPSARSRRSPRPTGR